MHLTSFQMNCLSFINAMINSPPDIDVRTHLRREFLNLGLEAVISKIKQNVTFDQDPDLITQIDMFEEEMR